MFWVLYYEIILIQAILKFFTYLQEENKRLSKSGVGLGLAAKPMEIPIDYCMCHRAQEVMQ